MKLILASASPRRKELLARLGLSFEVVVSDADESFQQGTPASVIPEILAVRKAVLVHRQFPESLVIAADTVVEAGGEILNKPESYEDAESMLRRLSGNAHRVHSGYCLRSAEGEVSGVCTTEVYFRQLDDSEIAYYLCNHPVMDKAGAYGIQDWIGLAAVERMDGSYFNVMGLPTHLIWQALRRLNFPLPDQSSR